MAGGFCLEVFAKNVAQLKDQLPLLSELAHMPGFCGFNLPNKTVDDPLHEMASMLREALPMAKICMHYSCPYRKQSLQSVLESCSEADSFLVVSGSKPKRNRDSVAVLQDLSYTGARLGVAFNPYGSLSHELARLDMKMKCEQVKDVWLQIGTNTQMLEAALQELRTRHPHLQIYGSVLLPTSQQLQQWRFRPWSGTAVEASALASVDAFGMAMQGCIRLLRQHGATLLIETRVIPKNVAILQALVGACDIEVDGIHSRQEGSPSKRLITCADTAQPRRRWRKKVTSETFFGHAASTG